MKALISIYVWVVGGLFFLFFLLFSLACSYLFPPKVYDPWIKSILRYLFKIIGTRVEVEGIDKLEPGRTYLFMANHVSLFDIPLLGGFIPGIVRGVEAQRQHKWPIYGWAMRRLGNVPIDRKNINGSVSSIRKTIRLMNNGRSMIILPEGHRTLNGQMHPLKKLPFFLARQIDKDLVPIGLSGLFELKPKGTWKITPTTIKIKFGDIITAEKIAATPTLALRDQVRAEIEQLIERP